MKRSTLRSVPGSTAVAPSDEALLAGMATGDSAATVAFVRRYQRRVYGLAIGIVHDKGAAEDVAQEAMVRAWRHAPVFDARRGSVENWVLTITRNLCIDALRRHRHVAVDPDDIVNMAAINDTASAEEALATKSQGIALVAALQRLPAEQRRAVVLASLQGRTAQEISDAESIPLGTAKTRIRAGMTKLRDLLNDEVEQAS